MRASLFMSKVVLCDCLLSVLPSSGVLLMRMTVDSQVLTGLSPLWSLAESGEADIWHEDGKTPKTTSLCITISPFFSLLLLPLLPIAVAKRFLDRNR